MGIVDVLLKHFAYLRPDRHICLLLEPVLLALQQKQLTALVIEGAVVVAVHALANDSTFVSRQVEHQFSHTGQRPALLEGRPLR